MRQGFFPIDIETGLGGRNCRQGMPVIRQCNHDGVEIVACKQFLEFVVDRAILVAVGLIDHVARRDQMVPVHITYRHDLNIATLQKFLDI